MNRAEIISGLKRELARSQRTTQVVAILLADIDHFKHINDSLGHAAGDEVLKEIANRLKSELRPYDLAGRYGGEEFLFILPTCNRGPAIHRAEQLRLSIANDPAVTVFGTIPTSVSIGVTVSDPESDFTVEELLQQADQALYRAKEKGRNRVEAFSSHAQSAAGS